MNQQDELARLFAQGMRLSGQQQQQQQQQPQQPPQHQDSHSPPVVHAVAIAASEKQPTPYFSSVHYTGMSYLRSPSEASVSPPPSYIESLMPETMAEMLRQNSIDPECLLPNQIHLFLNAEYEQRLRLLELWRISPPAYPAEKGVVTWGETNIAAEEAWARQRYEQQMKNRRIPRFEDDLDTHVEEVQPRDAEPYMLDGYSVNSPLNPIIYNAARNGWQATSYTGVLPLEPGMGFQPAVEIQIRNHADWERMNELAAREAMARSRAGVGADDEMML